jgi:hypothetical protein
MSVVMERKTLSFAAFILHSFAMDATSFAITDAELIEAAENAEQLYEQQLTDAELTEAAENAERLYEQQLTDKELMEASENVERHYRQQQMEQWQTEEGNVLMEAMDMRLLEEAKNTMNKCSLMWESWQPLSPEEEAELIVAAENAERLDKEA